MSVSGFFEYVKRDKRAWIAVALLIVGLAIIVMGSVLDAGAVGDTDVGEEERIAALCAGVEGVGKCQVTVNYDGDALVSVVVLCEGGDSVAVKKRLSDILATLYDVGYNRIMIDRLS